MTTIPIKSLKIFKGRAAKISQNKILPICSYLLFDFKDGECSITKSNSKSFVQETVSAGGEGKFLIDEKSVFDFIDYNKGELLSIQHTGTVIKLSCGIAVGEAPTDNPELFPKHELPEGSGVSLTPTVISEIKTAAKLIIDEEIPTPRGFVFVGKGLVAGSDAIVAYFYQTDANVELVLRKEVVDAIPDNGTEYHSNSSYDFFVSGNAVFGFVKSEYPFVDMNRYALYDKSKGFAFSKAELLSFNEWAAASSPNKGVVSTWNIAGKEILLESKDILTSKGHSRVAEYSGKADGSFSYLAESMSKLLKNLPGDDLLFYQEQDKYYITDLDKTFTALIMRIV